MFKIDWAEGLCRHLKSIGLEATVESNKAKSLGMNWILGTFNRAVCSVRIANREIDLIELVSSEGGWGKYETPSQFKCDYEVWAEVDGLEDKLRVKMKPLYAGFLHRAIVDFKWIEKVYDSLDLAKIMSKDYDLKNALYRIKDPIFAYLETEPDNVHQCVRIMPNNGSEDPARILPTPESFEAYDKIAKHLRSIANIRLYTKTDIMYEDPLEGCGTCAFYLKTECPREYAADNELWRRQEPCDLFKLRRQDKEG